MNRAQRRAAAKAAGVRKIAMRTLHVPNELLTESNVGSPSDAIGMVISGALDDLIKEGADPLAHAVVTLGAHPDHPDTVTVQVKTDRFAQVDKSGESNG